MYVSTEVATAKHVYECLKAGIDILWVGARTQGLEAFLRYNYPKLHRFNEEEQAQVANHYPEALSFNTQAETHSTQKKSAQPHL